MIFRFWNESVDSSYKAERNINKIDPQIVEEGVVESTVDSIHEQNLNYYFQFNTLIAIF